MAAELTPGEARAGRETIQAAADAAGREVEADHFGISIPVVTDGIPDELVASVRHRASRWRSSPPTA